MDKYLLHIEALLEYSGGPAEKPKRKYTKRQQPEPQQQGFEQQQLPLVERGGVTNRLIPLVLEFAKHGHVFPIAELRPYLIHHASDIANQNTPFWLAQQMQKRGLLKHVGKGTYQLTSKALKSFIPVKVEPKVKAQPAKVKMEPAHVDPAQALRDRNRELQRRRWEYFKSLGGTGKMTNDKVAELERQHSGQSVQ